MTSDKCDLRNEQQREKREESRERSEESRERQSRGRGKSEEEKREERREEREERREKREDRPKEAARGPQMRPPEVPTRGADPFLHHTAPCWDLWWPHLGTEGRGKRAEKRKKREERKWPPARFTAFLRCPVTTSMRTQKTPTRVRGSFSQKCRKAEGATKMVASSIPCISAVSRGHLKEVLKIRGGHRNCSKLESLHFFGAP